jgi:hypothetical protein
LWVSRKRKSHVTRTHKSCGIRNRQPGHTVSPRVPPVFGNY